MARVNLILLGLVLLAAFAKAQEETICRGQEVVLTDVEKAQVTYCLDEQNIKSIWKIPIEKVACLGVCILQKKSMLTEEGKINHAKALDYIDRHMPDATTKKLLIDAADGCIKEHGEKVRIDNDPQCSTFMGVGMCVHDAFLDICTS